MKPTFKFRIEKCITPTGSKRDRWFHVEKCKTLEEAEALAQGLRELNRGMAYRVRPA